MSVLLTSWLDPQGSQTHGFFISMEGFRLFKETSQNYQHISHENNKPLHMLYADNLMRDGIYSFAMPTKAEIEDG